MKTAAELQKVLDRLEEETGPAIAAVGAMAKLKSEVDRLRHLSVHADTDEEATEAGRKLIKASEDLRLAEIIAPRREAAAAKARLRYNQGGSSMLHAIAGHFEKLAIEARALASQVALKLVDPVAMEYRADQTEDGRMRDQAVRNMAAFMMGNFRAHQLQRRAEDSFGSGAATVPNALTMLDTFDADTACILGQIDKLKAILSVVNDGEQAEAGLDSPASADTADEHEPALAG